MNRSRKHPLSLMLIAIAWAVLALSACDDGEESTQCVENSDCAANERCVFGKCEADEVPDGVSPNDGTSGQCDAVPSAPGDLLINEVFSAPKAGEHDSNCDGNPSSTQDEFVEIVNNTDKTLDLTNVKVLVNSADKATLDGCLDPGRAIVVFSGGQFSCDGWGGTQGVVSDKSLSLANSGTFVELGINEVILDSVVVPSLSGESYTRTPDFAVGEDVFGKHGDVSEASSSPGHCIGGEELIKGQCGGSIPTEGDVMTEVDIPPACSTPPAPGDLFLNEIHAAPKSGEDDANCDSNPSSTQDEFVEIVNVSSGTISLDGVQIGVNDNEKHVFGAVCLDAGKGIVVYSGGSASCTDLGGTQALVSDKALSLANSGTFVKLTSADSEDLDSIYIPELDNNASFTRVPDFTGEFEAHDLQASLRSSPGKCRSGGELLQGCEPPGSCVDEIQNGDETDTDCGGSCDPCASDQGCLVPEDCQSGVCTANLCEAAQGCGDGIQNGDETDTDCGGPCDPCTVGQHCLLPEDCDTGICADEFCVEPAETPGEGMVIITEVMPNPDVISDTEGEWVELYNTSTTTAYGLQECELDGNALGEFVIEPQGYLTVARSANAGFTADIISSMGLNNSNDGVALVCASVTVDEMTYGSSSAGKSLQLDPGAMNATANDDQGNWCDATQVYSDPNLGTPGALNDSCQ